MIPTQRDPLPFVRLAMFFDGARQGRRDAAREMAEVTW